MKHRVVAAFALASAGLVLAGGCGEGAHRSVAAYPVARADAPDATVTSAPSTAGAGDAGALLSDAAVSEETSTPASTAQSDASPPVVDDNPTACNVQPPQEFLIRRNFFPKWNADKDEAKRRQAAHQEAINYRTQQYGYFQGFGRPDMNPHPPSFYVETIKWFGLPVTVHKKIVPALKCVEEEIRRVCTDKPYTPRALGGIRHHNTYHTGEITNHAYGIAMDIDPALNSCCGCVPPWNSNPLCHRAIKTEYDRMAMPECWVHAFERFGFYWLGHDILMDTMHYEFLGEPDKILKTH